MKEYQYYVIPTHHVPKSEYSLGDNLFIVPLKTDETGNAIALCQEIGDGRQPKGFKLLNDFIVLHSLINSSDAYIAHEKNKIKIERKSFETKEDFIESLNRKGLFVDKYTGDYDRYPPFYDDTLKNPELGISYKIAFQNFIEAKNNKEKKKLYDGIRLYVFSCNLKFISKAYKNDDLRLSLLYTILDAFLGNPEKCNNVLTCSSCGKKIEHHSNESLGEYQNRKLEEFLINCDPNLINNYKKILRYINRKRAATYHFAFFYNITDEIYSERKNNWPKKEVTEWDFEKLIRDIKTPDGRELLFIVFSELIKTILINELIDEKKFCPKNPKYSVCRGTSGY